VTFGDLGGIMPDNPYLHALTCLLENIKNISSHA